MNYANMLPGGGDGEKLFGFPVNERMLGTFFFTLKNSFQQPWAVFKGSNHV